MSTVVEHFGAVAIGKQSDGAVDAGNLPSYSYQTDGYIPRGTADKKLLEFHELCSESPNKWQVIETKANFIHGAGLDIPELEIKDPLTGKMVKQSLTPEQLKKRNTAKQMGLFEYLDSAAMQLSFADEINIMVEYVNTTDTLPQLAVLDNNDVRVAKLKPNARKIEGFYVSTEFGKAVSIDLKKDAFYYPAFDFENPKKYPISIFHIIMPKPGQRFYGLPSWWGTKEWTKVTNDVPKYYAAIMENGAYGTNHYKYPKSRFEIEGKTDDEIKAIKAETFKQITDSLTGVRKSGKVIFTEYEYDAMNKQLEDIKIEKIETGVNDKAFIDMGEMGMSIQLSGHGTLPRLAGMSMGNGMGSSGKEVNAEADFMQDFLMPIYRKIIVRPINAILEACGQPDVVFKINRIDSYTYDSTAKNSPSNPINSPTA